MATYLKSTNNKQSINVVLSHLCSNFVNMLCRECPEGKKQQKKRQINTYSIYSFIRCQQLKNTELQHVLTFFLFPNALTCPLLCL